MTDEETEAQRNYTICPLNLSFPIFNGRLSRLLWGWNQFVTMKSASCVHHCCWEPAYAPSIYHVGACLLTIGGALGSLLWLPCYIRAACLVGLWTPKRVSSLHLSLFPQHLDQHGHVAGILPPLWFQSWRIPFQQKHHWVSIKWSYLFVSVIPTLMSCSQGTNWTSGSLESWGWDLSDSTLSCPSCLWALGQAVLGTHRLLQKWFWLPLPLLPQRRECQPTPIFLPREFHEQRSLVSYSPWGHKEMDMTEWLTHTPHCSVNYQTKNPCIYKIPKNVAPYIKTKQDK